MEFIFYFALILALVAFAGFMLYARFSVGQEKALHHPPLKIASEEVDESRSSEETVEPVVEEIEIEEPVPNELPPIRAEAIEAEEKGDDRKSEYLDELQEAAAGLAMLMRSSASNRTTPVVFAPEEEEKAAEAAPIKDAETEQAIKSVETAVPAEVIETVEESNIEEKTASVPEKRTLVELIGADVADQFGKIDSDLDALEALVSNIETGLSVLVPIDEVEQTVAADEAELTEAA